MIRRFSTIKPTKLPIEFKVNQTESSLRQLWAVVDHNKEYNTNCYLRTIELDKRIRRLELFIAEHIHKHDNTTN